MSKNNEILKDTIHIDKFFLSYTDEEIWLNKKAASGFYLVKKSFYRYYFKKDVGLDVKYTVELLEHPATNPLSAEYIEEKRKKGIDLVANYKCRAYFMMNNEVYKHETKVAKKSRVKSVASMFFVYLIAFITSVVMFCAHCVASLNFTVENSSEKMNALSQEFSFFRFFEKLAKFINLDSILGDYQSTPMALMFFIAVVIFSFPVALYFRELILSRTPKSVKQKTKNED